MKTLGTRARGDLVVAGKSGWFLFAVVFACTSLIASAQALSENLFLGIGYYPSFDAGISYGAIHEFHDGVLSDPLDSYETWSQGPHDLVNEILVDGDRLVFDREEGLAFLEQDQLVEWNLSRKIAAFVRDRAGNFYVASGYGVPILEKFSPKGESEWVSTLPSAITAIWLTMDLAEDQCTLWYSGRGAGGIFQFDVCRRVDRLKVSDTPARAIRVLGGGRALAATSSGLAVMDLGGRVLISTPYLLPPAANVEFVTISVVADRESFWVAEGTQYRNSVLYRRRLEDMALLAEYSIPRQLTTVLVVPDWRASAAPPVRRRGTRRNDEKPGLTSVSLER